MGLYKYGHAVSDEKKVARAQGYDYNASYKDLANICAAIRGKSLTEATKVLEQAISKTKAIPYKKFSKGAGHKSELGGRKGRYPVKEAKIVLNLLKNAAANAAFKGMDAAKLFVRSAIAYKQNVFPRYRKVWAGGAVLGYGRQATWANYVTARVEVTLEEREAKNKEKSARQ